MTAISTTRRPRWLAGLRVQIRVIGALMVRDALSRYGHHNFGFFWVIGEPLVLTAGIMTVWSLSNITHGSTLGAVPFALTGYTFLTLWRHIVFNSARVMTNNARLAFHRQISFLDVMFSKALLETGGVFSAFMIAFLPLWLLRACPGIQDPLNLICGFLLSAWFSLAFGMVIAGLSEFSEVLEHIIQPIMYLTLPLTGAFTMVDWMPPRVQEVMLWSPLVNSVEMFRSGLFPREFQTHWDATYILIWCITLTMIGLPLCRFAERHVEI